MDVESLETSYKVVKAEHEESQATLNTAEELLQTLLTGLSSTGTGNSGGGGYMGQLADAKARLAHSATEEEQGRMKLGMAEKELAGLEVRWNAVAKEVGDGKKKLESLKAETGKFSQKVADCGWNDEKEREGETAVKNAKAECRQLFDVGRPICWSRRELMNVTGTRCSKAETIFARFLILDTLSEF